MGVFPGFGAWISQNNQEPLNAESNRSQDVESKSVSDKASNKAPAKTRKEYYDNDEEERQDNLWHETEKKHPWYDAPPQVKVTKKNGLCHMHIEFTAGATPYSVFFFLTERATSPYFDIASGATIWKPNQARF
ncbi:hypothetical protein AALP_AA1G257200 [Arabis alpina]|uniref:Uncharacterized protein n=1 Tax=Arabis alpina TaxID=50452 RepID=A0A087HQP2_ARAAL|nr:hypothetical protein AALP_AA1G257200 [Arabis alpina]